MELDGRKEGGSEGSRRSGRPPSDSRKIVVVGVTAAAAVTVTVTAAGYRTFCSDCLVQLSHWPIKLICCW